MGKVRKCMEWLFIRNKRNMLGIYEKLDLEKQSFCNQTKRSKI